MSNINPNTKKDSEVLSLQHRSMIDLMKKSAAEVKGVPFNLNDELLSTGGVKELIIELNKAINNDAYSSAALEQLRDILIQKHYGIKTWEFLQRILPSPARTRSRAGADTYVNSLDQ